MNAGALLFLGWKLVWVFSLAQNGLTIKRGSRAEEERDIFFDCFCSFNPMEGKCRKCNIGSSEPLILHAVASA